MRARSSLFAGPSRSLRRGLAAITASALATAGLAALGVAGAAPAGAATFAAGDLVVVRVGTGATALSSAATAVFLDEYAPDGTLVQSVPLPTAAAGSNVPLTMSGSATSEGALNLSSDGRYLTLAGYGTVPGTASVASTTSASVPRVVARVAADGSVDTSTALTDAHSGNNVRGAVTDDGSRFWTTGGAGGIRLSTPGATTSTSISGGTTVVNFRVPVIADGQLYASSSSGTAVGINKVGTGLPTSSSGISSLVTPPSPYAFVLLDRDPAVPGVDSLYVADDTSSTGGILKYSFDGTAWTARGSFRPASQSARGLTGSVQADGSVRLVTTTATSGSLVAFSDTGSSTATLSGSGGTTLASPGTNQIFRGVAFAPTAPTTTTPPTITTQPQSATIASGSTATLTVAATGTTPLHYQWYQGSAGDTATPVGGDAASFTTPALTATTTYWVRVTNTAGSADSDAATVTVQTTPPSNTPPTITPTAVQPLALTLGDPGNPPAARTVTIGDAESAPDALSVTVTSDNTAIATASATGTGATRALSVTPAGVGTTTLRITVSDGELSATATMPVAVSGALPAGSTNLYGISDASTAIDLGGGYMVLGDDETNVLRVYSRTQSSYPVSTLDLRAAGLALRDADPTREIDIEASARVGNTIYWLGSHGQNSSGNTRLNRQELFTTTVTGSGASTTLALGGSYQNLRNDLIAWDVANGNRFGLAAAAAVAPEPNGFNIEGAEFAPDGTTLYVGFRSPLTGGTALVVPVTNVAQLVTANPTTGVTATFGDPIQWDLGGRGVREIRKNAGNEYLIVAGPPGGGTGAAGDFRLYSWNGNPTTTPQPRDGSLDSLATSGSIESIVDVPSPLTSSSLVQYITDSGDTLWYGDSVANKDLTTTEFRKVVSRSLAVGNAPACSADDVTIGSVQGTTDISPVAGQTVTVQGTVVGDYEGPSPALRGFYLEDGGDGNAATSDGVFVFNNIGGASPNSVSVGQVVQVTGSVSEFQGQTQVSATGIEQCGRTADVAPVDVTLPRASATDLEPYEGMLVRFHQTLTVTEHFQLGRFGQVVVSSGGRLRQPTSLYPAGDPRVAQLQAANDLNQLIVDDGDNAQNPDPIVFGRNGSPLSASNTLRGGDTLTDPVGVLTYTWAGNSASGNAYRLRPVNALNGAAQFLDGNPRPTTSPVVGGNLTVSSANLLNFFNTFGTGACTLGVGGGATDCRGAENATEYQRQVAKEVAAITSLNTDVVGVMELENDGYGPGSAIQALIDALNASAGPGTWAFVNPDAGGVTNAAGTDAIKAALLYRTAKVTPVAGLTFADTTAGAFERNPVAQTFRTANGGLVTVVANHFKSKGSCPTDPADPNADQGDGQSCWNLRRTQEAQELAGWLSSTVVPAAGTPDVLIVGDLNSYAEEDPIRALEAAGYVNLPSAFNGDDAYSYVFDGQWGYLDYVLASGSLLPRATGTVDVHINADEPSVLDYNTNFKTAGQLASLYAPDRFRTSDHDPVVAGFDVGAPATFTGTPASTLTIGGPYSFTFTPSGTLPITFSVTAGSLPAGLTLSTAGVLSGTPTAVASSTFTVRAANAYGSQERSFTIAVVKAPSTTVITSSAPNLLYRGSVSWTATITPSTPGAPTPTGTVQFQLGTTNLGSPVALVGGKATSPAVSNLPPGATTVTAVYSGDGTTLASQATFTQTVTFQITILAPAAGSTVKAGQMVPIFFRLTDAVGSVPDAIAVQYLNACRTKVSAAGAQSLSPVCAIFYDSRNTRFGYAWNTAKKPTGSVTITVSVTYPGIATAQTKTVTITLTP